MGGNVAGDLFLRGLMTALLRMGVVLHYTIATWEHIKIILNSSSAILHVKWSEIGYEQKCP